MTDRIILMVSLGYAYRGGLAKKKELFIFFEILDVATFRKRLVKSVPLITSVSMSRRIIFSVTLYALKRKMSLIIEKDSRIS